MRDALSQLADGVGRVVWLEGELGIGKSALVDALVAEASARQVTVLRGAGDEMAQRFPLYLAAGCVGASIRPGDPVRAEVADLVRGGDAGDGVLHPVLAASERILELVDRLCGAGAVLLVMEDLHWSDMDSLMVWERLGGAVDQLPLLLVGTSRPVARRPEVARARDVVVERAGVLLPLRPLDAAGVAELAGRLLAANPDPDLVGELARCGGNPLFVRERVAGLAREDLVEVVDGAARLRALDSGLPATLAATIRRRLGLLVPGTREVLRLAALLGSEFDARELALVSRQPANALMAPLEEAIAEGLLLEAGDRLAFRHAVICQALTEELPGSLRKALHGQFAQALADEGAPVNSVIRHLLAAPGTVGQWVARWLANLPEDVLFTEPEIAAGLLDRAMSAPVFGGGQRDALLARRVMTLFWLGDNARAGEYAADVARTAEDPELTGRMRLYQARAANRLAEIGTALAVAEAATADERLPGFWRARMRAWSALFLLKEAQFARCREQAERALADGTRLADPMAVSAARLALSNLSTGTASLEHIDAALVGLGTDPDAVELRLLLLHNRLAVLNNLGLPEEFDVTASRTLILASRVGAVQSVGIQWAVAMGCYDFGAWDEALVHLDSLQPPLADAKLVGRHGLAALLAARREEWERVREHVQLGAAVGIVPGDVRIYSGYLTAAQAIRAEADGDVAGAVSVLTRWLDPDLGFDAKERFMWLPDLVRLALAIGDTSTARAAVEAAEADSSGPNAIPRQLATAQLCRGQLDGDASVLRAAATTYQRHGWTVGHAAALEELAVRLASAASIARARAAFTQAARIYAGLGATWDLRRADARLRAHGIRRGPRSLYSRPASGWAALTPAESRVAELVAQGRSNPDIAAELYMSRRTAQAHVSHILAKLNLRSRMEIMRFVAERQ